MADLGLADPVDTAEALLQAVGVPGQVVVDHQVGALQVDAFAGGVGGQQHLHLRVVPERFLRRQAIARWCPVAGSDNPGYVNKRQADSGLSTTTGL